MNQYVWGWGTKEGRIHCQSGYEWVLNTAWVRGRNSSCDHFGSRRTVCRDVYLLCVVMFFRPRAELATE